MNTDDKKIYEKSYNNYKTLYNEVENAAIPTLMRLYYEVYGQQEIMDTFYLMTLDDIPRLRWVENEMNSVIFKTKSPADFINKKKENLSQLCNALYQTGYLYPLMEFLSALPKDERDPFNAFILANCKINNLLDDLISELLEYNNLRSVSVEHLGVAFQYGVTPAVYHSVLTHFYNLKDDVRTAQPHFDTIDKFLADNPIAQAPFAPAAWVLPVISINETYRDQLFTQYVQPALAATDENALEPLYRAIYRNMLFHYHDVIAQWTDQKGECV